MNATFAAIKVTPKSFVRSFVNLKTGKRVIREVVVETKEAPAKK